MKCTVCKRNKANDELVILSAGAFTQILPLLKDNSTFKNRAVPDKDSAVYICKKCFLAAYTPQKTVSAIVE